MELNQFQQDTQQKLKTILAAKKQPAHFETLTIPATYLSSEELGFKVTIGAYITWIYLDGADVVGGKIEKIFEIYDYNSLADLQVAYLKFISDLLPSL